MKKSSLKKKVWISLSIFAVFMLLCIWLLQIVSLDIFYEWSKSNEIKSIANKVIDSYKDVEALDRISFDKDVCIQIISKEDNNYKIETITKGCFGIDNKDITNYKKEFINSKQESSTYTLINPRFNNKTLIYSIKLKNNNYAFISASLEPVGSTVSLLKKQLIIITIVVLALAFLIAYTISKMIANPIEKITKESKKISKGNYDVKFDTKTDIKEITELENTLNEMAEELSKTETLRRELLANVSHDLKTPLTLIKANSEMVKDITYNNKEKRNNNLNTIINEVDRLNLLVEDILDLSRMQSNSMKLEKSKFNLNTVIKSIVDRFSILEKDGYNIIYDGFDINVFADKKRIEQVIYNLLNNAINYTGDNKKVYINLKKENSKLRVEIKDTGKGIDKKDIDYIWDKYYKVDKKYKRVSYGTGLGLSIVKNILILHNFNYGVNTSNRGTKFYFDIDIEKNK